MSLGFYRNIKINYIFNRDLTKDIYWPSKKLTLNYDSTSEDIYKNENLNAWKNSILKEPLVCLSMMYAHKATVKVHGTEKVLHVGFLPLLLNWILNVSTLQELRDKEDNPDLLKKHY